MDNAYRFVAVSFGSDSEIMVRKFITYPFSMIKIYNGNDEIPSSISHYARVAFNPSESYSSHIWGKENTPIDLTYLEGVSYNSDYKTNGVNVVVNNNKGTNAKYFTRWGFEFNYRSTGVGTTKGWRSPVWAIAAGKEKYIPGEICESEPKVKDYMVKEALSFYDKGYDGVEVRYTSHSSVISDYANYGYNDSIVKRYSEKYGTSIYNENISEENKKIIKSWSKDYSIVIDNKKL